MPASLEALQALSNPLRSNADSPDSPVQQLANRKRLLLEMKRNRFLNPQGSGATPLDIEDAEDTIDSDPYTGKAEQAKVQNVRDTNLKLETFNRPDVTAARNTEAAQKLALATGPAEAAAKGNLAVEQEKTSGAIRMKDAQTADTMKLLESISGAGGRGQQSGLVGPGGSIKPTVNASGGVSFTTTQMPALVQRARNQLMDARDKTLNALSAAEKQYPGINDEADKVDNEAPGGSALGRFFSGVTGIGAGKYGGPMDRAGAGIERANYTLGIPTPFANLAQEASFGNIEQMAGQLPGVRGLATITPLFKEHQSRWGHETPAATVQRLRHMARMMDETLHTLDTSGAGGPEE